MKRISKKIREEAALMCAVGASLGEIAHYATIGRNLDISDDAFTLAFMAWQVAAESYPGSPMSNVVDAEAEALLRTGWMP